MELQDIEQVALAEFQKLALEPHPRACNCEHCRHHESQVLEVLAQMNQRVRLMELEDRQRERKNK